ncbi:MAG: thermonuclease family protein [Planctomycetota bacterium]|jgi:endonuclease YncB( thermonuclease family)
MNRLLFTLLLAALMGCASGELTDGTYTVRRVLAGDLIELTTGHAVRYAGIKAPRQGEPFFEEARARNNQFVRGPEVRVTVRVQQGKKDEKGRPCALVLVRAKALKASVIVNTELLEAGLARIEYTTLPVEQEEFFEIREERARKERLGIWSRPR